MKKLFLSFIAVIAVIAANAQSELKVFPDWSSTTGSQNFFYKNKMKTDGAGNVYVAGATMNGSGNYDILLAKYNSSGVQQWIKQYNGTGNGEDIATGLYIDGSGNVYITGYTTTSSNVDMITIKYNSSGTQQWLSTYNGPGSGFDSGADIYVDGSSNIYVTGTAYNASGNSDIATIKYNSAGSQQWATVFNYTANLNDAGIKITNRGSYLWITGLVQQNGTTYAAFLLTLYMSNGGINSSGVVGSSSSNIDQVGDVVSDASGNFYIAGSAPVTGQGHNYDIIKLNSNFTLAWERTYNGGSSLDDIAKGIAVDASGNVYVTGYSTTSTHGKDIATVKYNSSGTQQWVQTFNGATNGDDEANAMAIDASGNIYITGYTTTEIDKTDYLTIKYNSSGTQLWKIQSDGDAHLNDKASNIAIDGNGDIVVTGQSETAPNTYQYCTVKYVERQIITPTDYNSESPQNSFQYYLNKGQIVDTQNSLVPTIIYYTNNSSPAFYIKKNSFSFVFAKSDTSANNNDTLHRIDLTFDKVNSSAKTYAMEEQTSYLNYFLPQCPAGITEVHGNQRLVTYNLFNNIDLMYSSNQNGIKYYFIIKPGATPTDLQLIFSGASSFSLNGSTNALTINSSIGSITFERPTAYQLSSANAIIPITGWQCAWQTNGASNKYKFYTSSYDNSKALIIQIDLGHSTFSNTSIDNLVWSTNYGTNSTAIAENNMALDVTTNQNNGDHYVVGMTDNPNFPVYLGSQMISGGLSDGFISKFDELEHVKWATFFGGGDNDTLKAVVCNDNVVYVTGTTASNGSTHIPIFPLTDPANGSYYKNSNSGNNDAFIARLLPSNGQITWSAYFGGADDDIAKTMTLGRNGEVFIAGNTTSTSANNNNCMANTTTDFPLCGPANSYYQNTNKGNGDIFIASFNSNNFLTWSTFYGSPEREWVSEMSYSEPSGNIYLVGSTNSASVANPSPQSYNGHPRSDNNFPLCDMSGSDDFFQASIGGFVSSFNTVNKAENWATNIKNIGDVHSVCASPVSNYFYISAMGIGTGVSSCVPVSNNNIPICNINGGYSYDGNDPNKFSDMFIAKFSTSTNGLSWSTMYPGDVAIISSSQYLAAAPNKVYKKIVDINVDRGGNVYIIGSNTGHPSTLFESYSCSGMYNKAASYAGDCNCLADVFILGFNNKNERLWATYFGADAGFGTDYTTHPKYVDISAAISTYSNKSLYITGYTGSGGPSGAPGTFPLVDLGGGAYYHEAHPNYQWQVFISKFDLQSVSYGIKDISEENSLLKIFPNPSFNNNIFVDFPLIEKGTCQIFNAIGDVIYQSDLSNTNTIAINVESFSQGCYFIRVTEEDTVMLGKFIKF